ncbi:hypothetical protein [Microbacterium sp. ZW T5_56]|uniref:hypothetical protein n=1 Tax=Microbacterium sp. ZW T5_56 TaxID=3378081 RepID=UPI00385514D6
MSTALRIISHAIAGVVIGFSSVFIAVAACLVAAFVGSTRVVLPGIIDAWITTENGAAAINIDPNFVGMIVAALVIAALYTALSTAAVLRRARRTSDAP